MARAAREIVLRRRWRPRKAIADDGCAARKGPRRRRSARVHVGLPRAGQVELVDATMLIGKELDNDTWEAVADADQARLEEFLLATVPSERPHFGGRP